METTMPSPVTPDRRQRLGEKAELQSLNQRLESYIYKQRERDATTMAFQREIQMLKEQAAKDLAASEKRAEDYLAEARQKRNEQSETINSLSTQLGRKKKELEVVAQELRSEKTYRLDVTQRLNDLADRLNNSKASLDSAKTREETLKIDLAATEKDRQDAQRSADTATATAEQMTQKAVHFELLANSLQEDLDMLRKQSGAKIDALEARIKALTLLAARSEDAIRSEWSSKLEEMLDARVAATEASSDEALRLQHETFTAKLQGYRAQLKEQGHSLNMEQARTVELEAELRELQALHTEDLATKDTLSKRLTEMAMMLKQAKARPAAIAKEKNAIIKKIQEAFERKDKECDAIMEVKIMLDREIKTYERLLEQGEEPIRKRRREKARQLADSQDREMQGEEGEQANELNGSSYREQVGHSENQDMQGEAEEDEGEDQEGDEREEQGGETPLPSARRTQERTGEEEVGEEASRETQNQAEFVSSMDARGRFVRIVNHGNTALSLHGWKLQAGSTGPRFAFEDNTQILPGGRWTLRWFDSLNADQSADEEDGTLRCITDRAGIWEGGENICQLVDPSGQVKATTRFVVREGGCSIM